MQWKHVVCSLSHLASLILYSAFVNSSTLLSVWGSFLFIVNGVHSFLLLSGILSHEYTIICLSILLLSQLFFEVIYYPHFKEKKTKAQRSEVKSEVNLMSLSKKCIITDLILNYGGDYSCSSYSAE